MIRNWTVSILGSRLTCEERLKRKCAVTAKYHSFTILNTILLTNLIMDYLKSVIFEFHAWTIILHTQPIRLAEKKSEQRNIFTIENPRCMH